MKLPLQLFLATSASTSSAPLPAWGYLSAPPPALLRSFPLPPPRRPPSRRRYKVDKEPPGPGGDPPSDEDASRAWSVLASTERWIRDTLDRSNRVARARRDAEAARRELHFADEAQPAPPPAPRADNPYARKEVSYLCETGDAPAAVAGGVFRRLREARELGERHGRGAAAAAADRGGAAPATLRQTHLVVIPNCAELADFATFDKLIRAINQARRAARDYVLKPKERAEEDGQGKDWAVSINCAHLHPEYGTLSPSDQLAALRREEEAGEVDVNLQAYRRNRDAARRSPYPSVIVEVRSTPPRDFGVRGEGAAQSETTALGALEARGKEAASEDVQRLEALFRRSAAKTAAEDPFYDALGEAFGSKQVAPRTPLRRAQDWVAAEDPAFDSSAAAFTESGTRHADAAYEFVFHNLAMLAQDAGARRGRMAYVVLPNFAPTSATSLDRFAGQVANVIRAIPGLAKRVVVSTFHPEHVAEGTRSPVPIVVLTWN